MADRTPGPTAGSLGLPPYRAAASPGELGGRAQSTFSPAGRGGESAPQDPEAQGGVWAWPGVGKAGVWAWRSVGVAGCGRGLA